MQLWQKHAHAERCPSTVQMLQEERSLNRKHAELQWLGACSCSQSDMTGQAGCCFGFGLHENCW